MNGRAKTVRRLAVFGVLAFCLGVFLLVIELQAVSQGDQSTISETLWRLWATQPWVILLVSHTILGPFWFLMGHWTAQSRRVYDEIRQESRPSRIGVKAIVLFLFLLAAPAAAETTIRESIKPAVEKTLRERACFGVENVEDCQDLPLELITRQEFEAYKARVRMVADATAECIREKFILHGGDLVSGAAAWKWCPECGEANPAGFSAEARVGLKVGALGAATAQCYFDAKDGKIGPVFKWGDRIITGGIVFLNTLSAILGRPVLKWGIASREAVAPSARR